MNIVMIIVIGWVFVTGLAALTQPSIFLGILTFLFTGALPCGLIIYFAGSRIRRERQKYKEMMAERAKNDPGG